MTRCEKCNREVALGEKYSEVLIAGRTVGEPPPLYAAKIILCNGCVEELLESL